MRTWAAVEAALQGRPGWRRIGAEYHGPCPVTLAGRDGAWFGAGSGSGGVRCGCRHCGDAGGRLDGEVLTAHLAAVAGPLRNDAPREPLSAASSGPRSIGRGNGERTQTRPDGTGAGLAAVWRAGVEADGTPGRTYLHGRGAWPGPVAALRWLPAVEAARIGLRPRLPDGAAGALLYRFAVQCEGATFAVQCEAVNEGGERMAFGGGVGKRPSVTGSDFDGGRRVFVARALPVQAGRVRVRRDRGDVGVNAAGEPVELAVDDQDPDGGDDGGGGSDDGGNGGELFDHDPDVTTAAGVNLAEGPIDALALAALWRMGIERRALGDRPIGGAAGVGGWRTAAVADWPGPVTLWVQSDDEGQSALAGLRLARALRRQGRAVRRMVAPAGMDWADVAAVEAGEREAIRNG